MLTFIYVTNECEFVVGLVFFSIIREREMMWKTG